MAGLQEDKFDEDLNFLMQCLYEVLEELGHKDLLPSIPWRDSRSGAAVNETAVAPVRLVQLLSISFQLLNMIEENTNVQSRRSQQSAGHLEDETGLWPWAFQQLKAQGFSEEAIQSTIAQLHIEPVLTAHPTEAKRATVLEHHRELYMQLVKRENRMWTPVEQAWLKNDIKAILERLWRTGEIYLQRPDVPAELRNVMHYLKNVFPEVLPWLDNRFETAWREAGFATQPDLMEGQYPSFVLGTWVGGDRDGHPLVTAAITRETLKSLRLNSLIVLRHKLVDLAKKISLSDQIQEPPHILKSCLEEYKNRMPDCYRNASERNPRESWRTLVNIMIDRLPIKVVRDHATQLDERAYCYRNPGELLGDFRTLYSSLEEIGADRLAQNEVKYAVRTLQTFGFHAARLDIRQNSQFHDQALAYLLEKAGVEDGEKFAQWDSARKSLLIRSELRTLRPLSLPLEVHEGPAQAVLACYGVLREYIEAYGYEGIGSLIVSMTHAASDLFTVYLLAREAGLMIRDEDNLLCPLPVVPLFETIDDLKASVGIMEEFFSHPITQASLAYQSRQGRRPMQQIMIGYSDSSKDGGIIASQWHLYIAQKELQALGKNHGIDICFFHGRGGTVSRGAGPIHRFLEALPKDALNGTFRMTEQGETIARKYANFATAVYNLELIMASVTAETLGNRFKSSDDSALREVMTQLSESSQGYYQKLIRDPSFMSFYRQATPIDVLEHSRIGSRPAKRTGQASLDDLRAIPWVFSWNLARYYLPSWYGVGSALAALQQEKPEQFADLCRNMPHYQLLQYILFNVETTVASADLEIMGWYAGLVEDTALRQSFMQRIESEFLLTQRMLQKLFGSSIEERRPHVTRTIRLRDQSLKTLHRLQIEQLREWRRSQAGSENSEAILDQLLLTINAIAGGMRNTG